MSSLGNWPATIDVASCRLELQISQHANASPFGGSEQVVDLLNDRWMAYLTIPQAYPTDAAAIEAFVNSFRGKVNTVNLWHFVRPAPQGTIAGAPTVSGAHAMGASTVVAQTTAGATVKAGDMLGVAGLLLQASADATASGLGVISIPLVNRLRTALTNGAAITLTKPTAAFRLLATSGVGYSGALSEEVTMTLGEAI